ncbi:hypothetical protein DSO57_1015673 [Entomophthora muscae]|uniref:Uncharacterized protein n=1 Tax=Entomophthora muscae TaxID=34485 RepID=A0ACC2UQF4_9FUNG|nr:hypothetical protein DSO57_1015673 [Entomophthora muscae]
MWIAKGFNPTTVEEWMSFKITPSDAEFLKGKLAPNKAAMWLEEGIKAEMILAWKCLLPDTTSAGAFSREGFSSEIAAKWYNIGAVARKAIIFKNGRWITVTVINWLCRNQLKYCNVNKYIHQTISPAAAIEWKRTGFMAKEALLWSEIQVPVDFAETLRHKKIYLTKISEYLTNRYTLDEALNLVIKKVPLASAPSHHHKPIKQITCCTATE